MASVGPQNATADDGGWQVSTSAAQQDGGGFATTTMLGDTAVFWGYDFSAIPTGSTILGLTVRLDAYKIEILGAGDMTLSAELSWNSGASWTTLKETSDLTTSEATYTLGGSADTWGRSWTVAELANLRLRVTSSDSGFFEDEPVYALDWAAVTVTYSFALSLSDSVTFTDALASKSAALALRDSVQVRDGGLSGGGNAGGENITGGVPDELAGGGPTFEAASESFAKMETMAVQIVTQGSTNLRVFQVSDSIAAQQMAGPGTFQPGILEWGDMIFEGIFGLESETPGVVLRMRNTTIADAVTQAPVDFATDLQQAYIVGAYITVSVYVEDAGVWYNKLLFSGKIEELVIREDYIEIRAFQVSTEDLLIPSKVIDDSLFVWGDAEGKRPEGFMGSAIPIFYGRFGITALKEYASGPMQWDSAPESYNGEAQVPAEFRRWTQGIYYAMMMGIRIPMLAPPLGVDLNRGYSQDASSLWDKMKHAFFVFGDRSAPQITMTEKLAAQYRFVVDVAEQFGGVEYFQHMMACTWDEQRNRGNLFVRDSSSDLPAPPLRDRSGCGDALSIRASGLSITGSASLVHGFFINRGNPNWGTTEQPKWSGLLQMCALSFPSLSQIRRTTGGVAYGTTAGVINPDRALDVDPDNYAEIPTGEVLSLQGPDSADPLGEIVAVRLGVLPHQTSTATNYTVEARWSHAHAMTLTWVQGVQNPAAGGARYYTIKSRYTPLVQEPGATASPAATGWAEDWKFVHYSGQPDAPTVIQAYPMDVRITAAAMLRIVHVWLEIVYRPTRTDESTKPKIEDVYIGTKHERRENAFGRPSRFQSPVSVYDRYQINPFSPEQTFGRPSVILLGGTGPRDTVDSTYTDTASSIIENPADIAGHLIHKYLGDAVFNSRAQGTSFGSFIRARDRLNALVAGSANYYGWKFVHALYDRVTVRRAMARLGSQCGVLFQEQLSDSGTFTWRAFVDEPDPATTAPERMYRTDGYKFRWDHIVPESFEVRLTDRTTLCTDFLLRYGDGAYEKFVRPTSNNFAVSGAAYQTACSTAASRFNVSRQLVIEAPDVWNHATAEALLKWHVDTRRTRRVLVEFDAFGQAVDLKPGHVIKFSDDIGQRIGYPGLRSGASWSSHQFNVLNVRISKDSGRPITVHVVAIECFERAA